MTRSEKGQRILDACLKAQRGGGVIHGIADMMLWTGMSHAQVWDGLNWCRDEATKLGADLISQVNRNYRVGDEAACREWVAGRMKYVLTAAKRAEAMMVAVSQVTGRSEDVIAARQIERAVTEVDRAIADMMAAI